MRLEVFALAVIATSASAQKVVGKAYGFGAGAIGGGDAAAVIPTNADELANYLLDDVARVILINKAFDFTGKTSTSAGCDKRTCKAASGGQLYMGDLSCGDSEKISVKSITYDTAGTAPLVIGSNKSILGVGGKGLIKGRGLQVKKGASNVVIQGIEMTNINPGIVWGGDALDLQGANTKIWVDHCKFSRVGRMFVVSHYEGSSATFTNNEFDGVTTESATCNGNHYWGLMFIGKTENITLDKNYFHDLSGRAPKLGQDGVDSYFHAVNNYFENMKGHAFDAYTGVNALVEGNAFEAVDQPSTPHADTIKTFITNGGNACSAALGRNCLVNSVDSTSGKLGGGSATEFISKFANVKISSAMEAKDIPAYVKANAGPSKLIAATEKPTTSTTLASSRASSYGTTMQASTVTTAPVATSLIRTSKAVKPHPTSSKPKAETSKADHVTSKPTMTSTAYPVSTSSSTTEETSDNYTTAKSQPPPTKTVSARPSASPSPSDECTAKLYYQCGGQNFTGPTKCEAPATCVKMNDWYSQCVIKSVKFRRAAARA